MSRRVVRYLVVAITVLAPIAARGEAPDTVFLGALDLA
jgi:hypothetical protein